MTCYGEEGCISENLKKIQHKFSSLHPLSTCSNMCKCRGGWGILGIVFILLKNVRKIKIFENVAIAIVGNNEKLSY